MRLVEWSFAATHLLVFGFLNGIAFECFLRFFSGAAGWMGNIVCSLS